MLSTNRIVRRVQVLLDSWVKLIRPGSFKISEEERVHFPQENFKRGRRFGALRRIVVFSVMDSLSSVSPSIVLPLRRHQNHYRRPMTSISFARWRSPEQFRFSDLCRGGRMDRRVRSQLNAEDDQEGEARVRDDELERAIQMDGTIPRTSDAFVKQVSSRAYDMRRHLQQSFDSSSYDVLEKNPWREASKSVFVLTHQENQLCTMRTRCNRSEVEKELGLLFSKGGKWRNQSKSSSGSDAGFQMLVEDIREGVLVFEDQNEAARYCDLLQGGGQNCEGVAEIEASSVFDLCQRNRALAVLFRRGRTPPLPESLKLNLAARKRSLEDQDELKKN
ncbi:hypothetical protein M569_07338 [Genlisea aurea]|uniref:Uncharacterized protein n=1 Tax=Genlisea aurea TaxID=192259 RepID=S8CJT8_9LAMI|nr:hypothetical protein M569_07338 [Genlisea aurea]